MKTTKQIYRRFRDSGFGLLSFLLLGVATWTWVSHHKTDAPSKAESSDVVVIHGKATNNLVRARASVVASNLLNYAVSPPSPGERTLTSAANRAAVDTSEATILNGLKVAAEVKVGKKTHHLFADGDRPFQRVYIKPEESVDITLIYSEEKAGDSVVIQVEDGGLLDDGKLARVAKLDAEKTLTFAFKASSFEGIHRVRLWNGADQKMLDFWAGEPLPLAWK